MAVGRPRLRSSAAIRVVGLAAAAQAAVLRHHSLRDVDPLAVCVDRTPAAYYVSASETGSHVWIVDLQGGGWCDSEHSCRKRCRNGGAMCSTSEDKEQRVMHGLFDPKQDPALLTANKVWLRYCTSDAHMGDGEAFGGMQFRGARVVSALFKALVQRHGLGQGPARNFLIFGGQSAGGRGAMANLDYVPEMLGASAANVDVVGFLDSPLWLDMEPLPGAHATSFGQSCRQVYSHANITRLGSSCAAAYAEDKRWKCIMGEYRMPHVRTPYLLVASQYDSFQLSNDVGHRPAAPPEIAYAEVFAKRVAALVASLRAGWPAAAVRQNAVLSWSCYSHATSMDPAGYDRQTCGGADGTTLDTAVRQFLAQAPTSGAPRPLEWIDNCTGFACGAGCASFPTARELPVIMV